jgi:hypothetical protein
VLSYWLLVLCVELLAVNAVLSYWLLVLCVELLVVSPICSYLRKNIVWDVCHSPKMYLIYSNSR